MKLFDQIDKLLKEAGLFPYVHELGCDFKNCKCRKGKKKKKKKKERLK